MNLQLQWVNALSTRVSLEAAVNEVVETIQQSYSQTPDLGIVFISSAYASEYPRLLPLILERLPIPTMIGCSGGGIVGMVEPHQVQEIENNVALSLSAAWLPEVEIRPFRLTKQELPDLDSPPSAWHELIGIPPQPQPHFLLLANPFAHKITDILAGLDYAYPKSVKIGGLASSGVMGVPNALFYHSDQQSEFQPQGLVGVALAGNISVEAIVAQGCRPIGKPLQITAAENNVILGLADADSYSSVAETVSPLAVLQDLVQSLSPAEQRLVQHSLFVGITRDEFKTDLQPGDFLIRNLMGIDPRSGAIAVGDRLRPGQRIQFHLRDAQTSAEDLEILLSQPSKQSDSAHRAVGALMFACLGRGENLYQKPNFDSELFARFFPNVPLGGFFCGGEIGPIAGQTFLHGYTSAIAIFRPRHD